MIETQKLTLTRDEVKVQFTGLAHDHLMASSRIQSGKANNLHHHHLNTTSQQQSHTQSVSLSANQQQQPQPQPQQTVLGCLSSIQDKANIIPQNPAPVDSGPQSLKQHMGARTATDSDHDDASALSTIAILRRQTMYDSLVLVKRFRSCLNGYTLEFPTSHVDEGDEDDLSSPDRKCIENQSSDCLGRDKNFSCGRTKLVSVYLDGDDPMYHSHRGPATACNGFNLKFDAADVVYVPINGLLDRLDNYDRHGISIDSRVYAFAMGLKTAERFLTSSSEKEIQEAPPL